MGNFTNELYNYQNVPRELVFDSTLSDRARFVYIFMGCKPNDWDFYLEPMAKEIGYSVDTLRKYINELVASGWLVKGEQQKEGGMFGAVQYTLKATKFSDTEKTRHGKNPTQTNNNIYNKQDINKEEIKELKEKFAAFVFSYKKAGGKVRGVETEFSDFTKRHKDWKQIIPYLEMALQREIKARNQAKANKQFYPEMKMLQTYLGKQRAWELYVTIGETINNEEYNPSGNYSLAWDDASNAYMYIGYYYDGMDLADGYTDDTRPNGAKIVLNNARGTIIWNSQTKKWEYD